MLGLVIWAALAPLRAATREKLVVFGVPGRPVPAAVQLTLGVQDVLLLRNESPVAHVFGPLRVGSGKVFRLPFEQAGEFGFTCSALPGAYIVVHVVAPPDPGLARLRWRFDALADTLRTLPLVAPYTN